MKTKTWCWIIGIVLVLSTFYFLMNSLELNFKQNELNNSLTTPENSPYNHPCPRFLIPERFDLDCSELFELGDTYLCRYKPNVTYYWGDGSQIGKYGNLNFRRGSWTEENINYLYSKSYNIYEHQEIFKDGTIRWNHYAIRFILDLNDKNNQGYKVIKYTCSKDDWIDI